MCTYIYIYRTSRTGGPRGFESPRVGRGVVRTTFWLARGARAHPPTPWVVRTTQLGFSLGALNGINGKIVCYLYGKWYIGKWDIYIYISYTSKSDTPLNSRCPKWPRWYKEPYVGQAI